MASLLLSVPREIRDEIITLVVFSKEAPPENPSAAPQDRISLKDPKSGKNILYDRRYNDTPASLPLLLVNRQLSTETRAVLDRCPSLSYHVDIMLVNERELWVTWLSVPAFSRRVDNVVATFRVFGAAKGGRSGLRGGDGGPPPIVWTFYSLLDRFLEYGAAGELKSEARGKGIFINTLTMNFIAPSSSVDDGSESEHGTHGDMRTDRHSGGRGKLSRLVRRPASFCGFLSSRIEGLLTMSLGAILHERISFIRFCVGGALHKPPVDLVRRLANIREADAQQRNA